VEEQEGITQHPVSSEVSERVRAVLSSAEAAASALRHEAEQEAYRRRRASEEEARQYLEDARRDADAFLQERLRRISELSDTILERGEQILARLDHADEVRLQLQSLVGGLGETAARLAADARGEVVATPTEPASEAAAAEPVELHPRADEAEHEPETPPEEAIIEAEVTEVEAVVEPDETAAIRGETDDDELAARLVALQMAVAGANRGDVEAHLQRNFSLDDPATVLDDVFGRGTDSDKRVTWPEPVRDTGS
jgi:hypothetical protein